MSLAIRQIQIKTRGASSDQNFILFIYFLKFIFEREREREWWRGREREGDAESEAGSRHRAVSTEPDAGLELTNGQIMTRAEVRR